MRKFLSAMVLVACIATSGCANMTQALMGASATLQGMAVAVNASNFALNQSTGIMPNQGYGYQQQYYIATPAPPQQQQMYQAGYPQQYQQQQYNPYQQQPQYVNQQFQQYPQQQYAQPVYNGYNNNAFATPISDEAAREAANAARDAGANVQGYANVYPGNNTAYQNQVQYVQGGQQFQQFQQPQYVQQQPQYYPQQQQMPQQTYTLTTPDPYASGQYQPQYQQTYQQPYQQPYQNTGNDAYLDYLNGTVAYDPATDTAEATPLVVTEPEDTANENELQEELFDFYLTSIAEQHEAANDNEEEPANANWVEFLVEL